MICISIKLIKENVKPLFDR